MRAGAAWEKQGRAVRSQGPTILSVSWRSMGEMGRAVRSQGPTFLSFVTKLLREKDQVWRAILLWWGIFRGPLYYTGKILLN